MWNWKRSKVANQLVPNEHFNLFYTTFPFWWQGPLNFKENCELLVHSVEFQEPGFENFFLCEQANCESCCICAPWIKTLQSQVGAGLDGIMEPWYSSARCMRGVSQNKKQKEIFQQVKTSKGKVFVYPAYFHFPSTKAIRASYKSLSLHVIVYSFCVF